MSHRSFLVAVLAFALIPSIRVPAQDAVTPPDVENSKYQFDGAINTNSVYVRSGPGEGYYATQELSKGAKITVVGIKFDWLKILPPEGSFSYVGKVFVDRQGTGTTGRINRDEVNVRAGSNRNEMKTTVQARLNTGDTVEILGEQDEYYKIKPPAGAYLYINKQFVDAVAPTGMVAGAAAGGGGGTATVGDATKTGGDTAVVAAQTGSPAVDPNAGAAGSTPDVKNTSPSIDGGDVTTTVTPGAGTPGTITPGATATPGVAATPASTQPAVASAASTQPAPSAEEIFGALEQKYAEVSKQPLEDQSLTDLATGYQGIANSDGLSDTLKHVVDLRIATLKVRVDSQAKLLEARRVEKEAAEKALALQAEQQELQERLKQTEVEIFTAVGTLEPSSLQLGDGGTLYRLTDPATGRTVIYLRSNDPKVVSLTGQFVGVKGDAATDPQLSVRVIAPTDVEPVDPTKVNGSIAAEIVPPSLMARQAASTN